MASYYDQVNGLAPKVWYRFNETAGTPTNSGSLSTTGSFETLLLNEQTDVDGRAIYFDGSSSVIRLNSWPSFSLFDDKSFTIETWFKLATIDTNDRPMYRFSGPAPVSQSLRIDVLSSVSGYAGKLQLGVVGLGEQTADRTTISTNAYNDNRWHHVVVAVNTTSLKWYIDGNLEATKTLTTGTLNWDNYTSTGNLQRLIGASRSNVSSTISTTKYRGWLDEFAIYGYELTAQNVLDNFNAGASVQFADIPGTASALMLQPTQTTTAQLTADPMTASSASGDHYNSTVEFPTLLNTYMSGLTLQTWFKFDKSKTLTDYGTEPTRASSWGSLITNNPTGGIQGSGELVLLDDANSVNVLFQNVPNATGISALLNDEDFTIGFWTKKLVKEQTFICSSYKTDNTQSVNFQWNSDGGISFVITHSNTNHTISSNTDITDGEWHFVVGKLSSGTMQLWVDNTSIGTTTMNQNLSLDRFQFDATTTDKVHISQFFVTTASAIGTTEIANMWDYGTPTSVQASAYMPDSAVKFDSAFNDYIQSKNPVIDYRLDETTGSPVNFGSASISLVPYLSPQGFTQGETGLNNRAFKFTTREQTTRGTYSFNTGTFSTDDLCTIGVVFKIGNATNQQGIVGFGGREQAGVGDGNGFSLQMLATSGYLRVLAGNANGTVTNYTGTTNYADGKWHLAVIVKEASTVKLYVDGKEHLSSSNSTQMTDTGEFIIGGVAGIVATSLSVDKLIDEVFVTNTAFTAQEVFEAWQKLRLEMDTTATASLPMPTNIAGTGTTQAATVTTASSLFEMPTFSTDQVPTIDPATASAEFLLPNFGGNVVIDANYGHEAFTASAVFHDPQLQIGDFHGADHMDASAYMVHPTSISGGQISVSTHIGGPAVFVMPGIVTIKGARVFAEPARASAILPLPPAYLTLQDDKWFVTLLEGHADRITEPVQANLGNLPNQTTIDVIKGGFLSFFNEFNTDITTTTQINSIENEIPAHYFDREDIIKYDSSGNMLALDTSKNISPARAPRGTSITTPRMGVGYFDPYERKAVRVENIEFPFPGTSSDHSERPYNLEFSIKTTKKDQVLAYGIKTSYLYYSRSVGAIGLSDGKIYLAEDGGIKFSTTGFNRGLYPISAPHPKNFINRAQYLLSKTDIADGQWHHIIIQKGYGDENLRTQIWIDGKLDRQLFTVDADGRSFYSTTPGLDGTNNIRPYILGFNSNDPLLYSDFETSGWNFYPGRFITSQKTLINYSAYLKYEPIKAEPMTATLRIGQETIGQGNRARMLLLYWWRNPVGYNQFVNTVTNPLTTGYDGNNSPFSPEDLIDDPKKPPQDWYGWDVFPVGVVKPSGTDIAKPDNIGNGVYLDIENGRTRMLDLQKDLDLSQFDMIMFANYPSTSAQLDEFIREEFVDKYFGVTEKDVYQDFLKSLRKAVDSGMSLMVQFDQLARDLGVYDRIDRIPVFKELDRTVFDGSDPRAIQTTSTSWNYAENKPNVVSKYSLDYTQGAYWPDRATNMRHRVVNTIEYLTDDPSYIWTDTAWYQHSDLINFAEPDRAWHRYEYKINGLAPGDEFIFGNPSNTTSFGNNRAQQNDFLAIPFDAVKAGKIITAQPQQYYKGLNLVDNPYKNYAHSIAIEPGDVLNGTPVGGKIFVSISETFWDYTPEERIVDLYTDYWVDLIYDLGGFGLKQSEGGNGEAEAERARLKAKPYFRPIIPQLTAEHNAHRTYWSSNGELLFTSYEGGDPTGIRLGAFFGIGAERTTKIAKARRQLLGLERVRDSLGRFASGSGGNGTLFFQIKTSRVADTANVYVPNLLTRGIMWLSDRITLSGKVNRVVAMTADARLQPSAAVVDKDVSINATSMLSNAILPTNITGTITTIVASVTLTTLPLTATGLMTVLGKQILPEKATATARIPEPGIFTYSAEDVILKIENYEPILYIRGDKIT